MLASHSMGAMLAGLFVLAMFSVPLACNTFSLICYAASQLISRW